MDRRASLEPDPRRVARRRRSGRAADGHGGRQPVPQRSGRRLDGGRARRRAPRSSSAANGGTAHDQDRRLPRRQLHDGGRRRRDGDRRASFPVPDDRTAGSYQKVERKVGDYRDRRGRRAGLARTPTAPSGSAGIALSAAGPCAVRVDEAERLLAGQKPTADLIRAAADAASSASAPQADLRGSVEYKKHLAGVLVARGSAPGVGASGGAGMKVTSRSTAPATSATSSRARCSPTSCARTAG